MTNFGIPRTSKYLHCLVQKKTKNPDNEGSLKISVNKQYVHIENNLIIYYRQEQSQNISKQTIRAHRKQSNHLLQAVAVRKLVKN